MRIHGPVVGVAVACEQILRTLPAWFGIETSLIEYAHNTDIYPTLVAEEEGKVIGFVSLLQHFTESWELTCIAVNSSHRGQGVGKALHGAAETWLGQNGAALIQVKTLAATHSSAEYAETRAFYESLGYCRVEIFSSLWAKQLPVLQLIKVLPRVA